LVDEVLNFINPQNDFMLVLEFTTTLPVSSQ